MLTLESSPVTGRQARTEMQTSLQEGAQLPDWVGTLPVRIIERRRSILDLRLKQLWHYRELLGLLAWRDIAVRYKQTIIGVAWAIVQPLAMMLAFSVVFRRWVHMPSEGVSYPLFTYAGLLIWQYFSTALLAASSSLIRNANILTKVNFPRLVLPASAVLPPLVDFALAFSVLLIMMYGSGAVPTWRWIVIPFLLLQTLLLSLGVGIWLSSLSVRYRDLSQCLPFLMQLWMFASPIVYPSDMVSWNWRLLYVVNPMVSICENFRWALLGTHTNLDCHVALSVAVTIIILLTGIVFFQHIERTMADHI
jgi:lipopolysaccharide transport system permease protein